MNNSPPIAILFPIIVVLIFVLSVLEYRIGDGGGYARCCHERDGVVAEGKCVKEGALP